jgi:hypothetical protein
MRKYLARGVFVLSAAISGGVALAQTDSVPVQSSSEAAGTSVDPAREVKAVPLAEAKQDNRVLGVLPNYRTADGTKPYSPLTPGQKVHIALKDSFDWPSYLTGLGFAGIYQLENQNPSFGQGVKGFASRYGTSVADQVIGNMFSEGFMPVLLKEDPRYFRKVNGSFMSRFGYAATRTLIAKDDHGKNCVNFAEITGNGIGAVIGLAYYPDARTVGDTFERMGTAIATDTISNIMKEFWPDMKRKWFHKRTTAAAQ